MSMPVGTPAIATAWIATVLMAALIWRARARRGGEATEGRRTARSSIAGIALQGIAIGWVCVGTPRIALPPASPAALVQAAVVLLLAGGADWLFLASTRAMGRNWSLVARTRGDHALVTSGPFAYVRHPIYAALFLLMAGYAVAFGHLGRLPLAAAIYAAGTVLRVRIEERLLRDRFGDAYAAYAARVTRFVPKVI